MTELLSIDEYRKLANDLTLPGNAFIDGTFRPAVSGKTFTTTNPATGDELTDIAACGAEDVDLAAAAARTAFDDGRWSRLHPGERKETLLKLADLMEEHARELAVLESIDGGKTIFDCETVDVPETVAVIRWHAELIDKIYDQVAPASNEHIAMVVREPVGVVGLVLPWNFPLLMLAWKIAPALATGNTVVLKPAETTPLTALLFADLLRQAELPPGVVNLITGAGPTGSALVTHADVDKVAFTGSTAVGRLIAKQIAGTRKHATLELGGKAANIVFEDAAIDQAIEGIVNGIYFNQGQVCCAGSRLLVAESVAEEVTERLKQRLSTLRVGDPMDKNTDVGAINSAAQLERITALTQAGQDEGATRWTSDCPLPETGYWFAPTIFTGVSSAHRIAREEIFGPVLSVLTFRTPDEAIAKANNIPYGLSAGIWTEKGSRILAMADAMRAGVVWANTFNRFDPTSPFGGYKESGYGREGGRHGLAPYLVGGDAR